LIRCALLIGSPLLDPASILTEAEAGLIGPRAVAKRQNDFLRGRWIAKRLLMRTRAGSGLLDHSVLPDRRGVPIPFTAEGSQPLSLSISHTDGFAAAAMAPCPWVVGIDVERPIANPALIAMDYFTEGERKLLDGAADRPRMAALIWSAKEAVAKALGEGLRLALLGMEVVEPGGSEPGCWHALRMRCRDHDPDGSWHCFSWHEGLAIVTVAAHLKMGSASIHPHWELRV
jgi:4'-phosphopantetheinyl transferase